MERRFCGFLSPNPFFRLEADREVMKEAGPSVMFMKFNTFTAYFIQIIFLLPTSSAFFTLTQGLRPGLYSCRRFAAQVDAYRSTLSWELSCGTNSTGVFGPGVSRCGVSNIRSPHAYGEAIYRAGWRRW